jgi:hypothetical protein
MLGCTGGAVMRTLRNALNPLSTGFTRWWCHSGLRALLRGQPRDFYRRGPVHLEPMDPQVRQARIDAIERILADRGNRD